MIIAPTRNHCSFKTVFKKRFREGWMPNSGHMTVTLLTGGKYLAFVWNIKAERSSTCMDALMP